MHLWAPSGGPNEETGDSAAARGKNGETDDSYNPAFGGPPSTGEGKSCWIQLTTTLYFNNVFQKTSPVCDHVVLRVIRILLKAGKTTTQSGMEGISTGWLECWENSTRTISQNEKVRVIKSRLLRGVLLHRVRMWKIPDFFEGGSSNVKAC